MKLTIASKITIVRICLIPLFVASYYLCPGVWKLVVPTALFVIASVTDWVDGYLARSRNDVRSYDHNHESNNKADHNRGRAFC